MVLHCTSKPVGEREEVEGPLVAVDPLRRFARTDGDGLGQVQLEVGGVGQQRRRPRPGVSGCMTSSRLAGTRPISPPQRRVARPLKSSGPVGRDRQVRLELVGDAGRSGRSGPGGRR